MQNFQGLEENGEPVHSAMYRDLFINGPKEMTEIPFYTFKEHFGRPVPSSVPREVLLDYLKGIDIEFLRLNTTFSLPLFF